VWADDNWGVAMTIHRPHAIASISRARLAALAAIIAVAATLLVAGPGALPASATGWSVANEAQYRAAIIAASADGSGPHTITITADFVIDDAGDPQYSGAQPLTINGGDHAVTSGVAATRFLSVVAANLTITDLQVSGFKAPVELAYYDSAGGAVFVENGHVTISGAIFDGNAAIAQVIGSEMRAHGGAVFVESGNVTVSDSEFRDNWVQAWHYDEWSESHAFARGGAISVADGFLHVSNTQFVGNWGSAVADSGDSFAYALAEGGALWAEVGDLTVTDSYFEANETSSEVTGAASFSHARAQGAAIYGGYNAPIAIEGSTFVDHVAHAIGSDAGTYQNVYAQGTVYAGYNSSDAPTIVDNSTFSNTALTARSMGSGNGGVTYAEGGAVYAYDSDIDATNVVASGATLSSRAEEDPAVNATAFALGGSLASPYGDVTVDGGEAIGNVLIANAEGVFANAVARGGAISSGQSVYLDSAVLQDHWVAGTASGATSATEVTGGGIYANDSVVVAYTSLSGNTSGDGGAIYAEQGAVAALSTLDGNTAVSNGGGVFVGAGDITVINSTLANNSAGIAGGALYATEQDTYVNSSTLVANSAPAGAHVWTADLVGPTASVFADAAGSDGCASSQVATSEATFDDDGSCSDSQLGIGGDFGFGQDPLLGGLLANGGATKTMMPMPGSPLIDVYDVGGSCSFATDQRDISRPRGEACDVGAVEKRPSPFIDVEDGHQFFTEIDWLNGNAIAGGYSDDTFRPTVGVSRQAMAAFLYRAAEEPAFVPPAVPSFTDVPLDHTFYLEIEWLASEGISTGYVDDTFRPSLPVTRQAMSAFLYRFSGEPAFVAPGSPSFSDVPLNHTFFDEIEWLASTEITTGYSDGTFRGTSTVSRQAMAAFLYRLDGLVT
jgi:predicted outer membrane repeat protein